jgi:hypothetical protein
MYRGLTWVASFALGGREKVERGSKCAFDEQNTLRGQMERRERGKSCSDF